MSQRAVLLLLCPPVLSVPGPAAALGPSDTLHLPSSSALAGRGDWLPELAEGGTVTIPRILQPRIPSSFCQCARPRYRGPGRQALALGSLPGGAGRPKVPTQ